MAAQDIVFGVRPIFRLTLALYFAAAAARGAAGQVVRGNVVDGGTSAPLYGALVIAYDSAGARVAGTTSNDSGRYALRLPAAGHFKVRAERIGYLSGAPVPFDVAAGETVVRDLRAASAVVVLPTDTVMAEARCVVRPTEGAKTATLWEEARKVLYASQLTERDRLVHAIRRRWWRTLDGTSLIIRKDSIKIDSVTLVHPFETPVSPEELAKHGYGVLNEMHDSALAGPDADVLLSDAFARTHCFQVRLDADKHKGQVGLAFEPARSVHFPEVTGVLWLDSASARLRSVEFRHTNLYPEVAPFRYGGRMDFDELPGGVWIVRRWYIRLPVVANGPTGGGGGVEMRYMGGTPHVARFHEEGGEVLSAQVGTAAPPP